MASFRRKSKPERLGDILSTLLKEVETPGRSRGTGKTVLRVFEAFDALGPPTTEHAEAVQFRGGILSLVVDDPTWLTELQFLRPEILGRMNGALGKDTVRELRFRLGTLRRLRKAAPSKHRKAPVLSESEQASVEAWTEEVKDPELRDRIRRAARWAFAKRS